MKRLIRIPKRLPFPFGPPSWPVGAEREPDLPSTGADYDTAWARKEPIRYLRGVLVEYVMAPTVRMLADPRVTGLDRLDTVEAPVIFAANHQSHLDTPLLLCSLPPRFRHRAVVAAAADYFFDNRVKAATSALVMSAIPMERTRVNRRSADLASDLLRQGWSLVIFPEGGRTPDGWAQEFRGGAAYLSIRCDVPVVPIHIEGSRRVLRKGAKRPTPSTVRVDFGAPMRADQGEDARRFATRIERSVAVLADEQTSDWWMARKRAAAGRTPTLTGPQSTAAWRRAWALGDMRRRRTTRDWP